MTLTIILIFMFAILIIILNRRDKLVFLFGIQVFCTAIMLFSCFLIIAKLTNYRSNLSIDLMLYFQMHKLKINIPTIVRIYNISLAIFMCMCCFQYRLFTQKALKKTILLIIPVVFAAFLNDPYSRYIIFTKYCDTSSIWQFNNIYTTIYILTAIIGVFYCSLPILALFRNYKNSRIRVNKARLLSLFAGLCSVILFVLGAFIFGPMSFMHFITTVYFPPNIPSWSSYIYLFIVLLLVFTAYIIIIQRYNFFFVLGKSKYTAINDNDSVRMLFHNYKNSFFIIERLSNQIKQNPEKYATNAAMIEEIAKNNSGTIAKIIESFKSDFAFIPKKFNLQECTHKAVLNSNIPEDIVVTESYDCDTVMIYGNELSFCDALINVINNAAESINCKENDKRIDISVFVEQSLSCVEIKDNGKGISKKDRNKIFSPFYSTKHGGKNNGIGLTYTKRIVTDHQGKINFKSVPNLFTSFQIVLPIYKNKKSLQ